MYNVNNVYDAVDRKVVEDKKVSMETSCTGTSPIFKSSNIVADYQKENANNDEDEFANIFPSLLFPSTRLQIRENIQLSSILLQSTDNIQGFLQPQDIKKNPPVAEIFSVQVTDVKIFAQFVITPLA